MDPTLTMDIYLRRFSTRGTNTLRFDLSNDENNHICCHYGVIDGAQGENKGSPFANSPQDPFCLGLRIHHVQSETTD